MYLQTWDRGKEDNPFPSFLFPLFQIFVLGQRYLPWQKCSKSALILLPVAMCDYWVLEINVISKLHFKKQSHYFANKGPASQNYGFSSNHVLMWELDHKESWAPENWCFWTVVLEKSLESPLDCKEIKLVNPKGNQPWIFIGRTDVEAETLIPWPPDVRNWLIWKDPDAEKDWKQEEKGTTKDEMVGWHHQLDGEEFEQAPGVGDGQGGLACCSPLCHKELGTTEWQNWTEKTAF